jgi:hypothetical protein
METEVKMRKPFLIPEKISVLPPNHVETKI